MARLKGVHDTIRWPNITKKVFNKMGRKAGFLERKLNGLNCMKPQYGSLESLNSQNICNDKNNNRKNKSATSRLFGKKNFVDRFTVSYDHSRSYQQFDDDDDDDELNESTKLLDIREMNGKRKKLTKKKYWSIQDRNEPIDRKLFRNNLKFVPDFNDKFSSPSSSSTAGNNNNSNNNNNNKKNGNKKPKSFLKRTGKFIVKTARFMSLSTPYTHLYYNGVPNDLNGYDFTRNTYGLDPTRTVYSYGYNPSVFF